MRGESNAAITTLYGCVPLESVRPQGSHVKTEPVTLGVMWAMLDAGADGRHEVSLPAAGT